MAEFGSFGAGMAQGMGNVGSHMLQGYSLGMQQQAAQRAQQLEQMKVAGEAVKNFADVMQNAPDEQLPTLTKMFLGQMEQISGVPIDKNVAAMITKDPLAASHMLMDSYTNNGGFTLDQLGKTLGSSTAAIGMINAYNKRQQYKDVSNASTAAYGGALPASQDPTTGEITPGQPAQGSPPLGNLPAAQARINLIDKAIATTMGNIDTPGAKERLATLQATRDSLDKNIQFAITNETMNQAAQMGVTDITKATPQIRQLVQQRVLQQMGLGKQAEATGAAMGGLVSPDTAAATGISPLSTVGEARGLGQPGGAGQPGAPTMGAQGGVKLPNPQDLLDLAAQRPAAIQMSQAATTAASSAKTDNDNIAQIRAVLPDVKTGLGAPLKLKIDRLAGAMGIDTKSLGPTQVFDMLTQKLSLGLVNQLPGAMSNKEDAWLQGMSPTLQTDPKAVHMLLDMRQATNDRLQEKNVLMKKFQSPSMCGLTGEKCGITWDEYWDKYTNTHSMVPQFNAIVQKYGYKGALPDANGQMPPGQSAAVPQGGASGNYDLPTAPVISPAAMPGISALPLPTDTGGGAAIVNPRGLHLAR